MSIYNKLKILGDEYFIKAQTIELQQVFNTLFDYVALMGYKTTITKNTDNLVYVVHNNMKTYGMTIQLNSQFPIEIHEVKFYLPGGMNWARQEKEITKLLNKMIESID